MPGMAEVSGQALHMPQGDFTTGSGGGLGCLDEPVLNRVDYQAGGFVNAEFVL